MEPIQIVIADDQLITRSGLHNLLAARPEFVVLGEQRMASRRLKWRPACNRM